MIKMKKLILFLLLFGNYVFAQKWVQIYDNGLKKAELLKYEDSIIDFSALVRQITALYQTDALHLSQEITPELAAFVDGKLMSQI